MLLVFVILFYPVTAASNPEVLFTFDENIKGAQEDNSVQIVDSAQYEEYIVRSNNVNRLSNNIRDYIIREKRITNNLVLIEANRNNIETITRNKDTVKVYPNRKYSVLLDDSVPLMDAKSYWDEGFTGKDVKIAILDSGIDSDHPMLAGKVVNAESFVDNNPEDHLGHGTHVAGIAAGKKTTEGYNGVAPDALLLNGKVLDDYGDGTTASIIQGINWAVDPDNNPGTDDGADIISMSIGAPTSEQDELINEALDNAIANDVVVVIASGNCGPNGASSCKGYEGVTIPGSYEPVITVGAVNNNLEWADFSSGDYFEAGKYGNEQTYIKPDVVAPGVSITSSVVGGYDTKKGTSMAAPFVAGAAALLLEQDNSLGHFEVKELLEENAVDLGDEGKDVKYGSGFVSFGEIVVEEPIIETTSGLILEDIGDFEFLEAKEAHDPEPIATSDKIAIYSKGQNIVYVEEVKFKDVMDFSEYFFSYYPITTENEIDFVNFNYNYAKFNDEIIFYDTTTIFSIKSTFESVDEYSQLLDAYSESNNNIVGFDFKDNLEKLKIIDNAIFKVIFGELPMGEDGGFNPQYGGMTPAQADEITFGKDYSETFWDADEPNWYHTSTTAKGTLFFEVYDMDYKDNLDLYVYDWEASALKCKSTKSGDSDEYCEVQKTTTTDWGFYINVPFIYKNSYTYTEANINTGVTDPCDAKWLNEYQCQSGNQVYRKYQNSDCTTEWKYDKDCDDSNYTTSWDYYCSSGNVKRSRTEYDYYCSSGSCSHSSTTETETYDSCGTYEKCVDNGGSDVTCDDKSCSDLGKPESCTYAGYLTGWSKCIPLGENGDPTKCSKFGGTYCYDYLDTCDTNEICDENGGGDSKCSPDLKGDGESCDSDSECESNLCSGGPKVCFNEDTCFSNNQCAHWWYGICVNDGEISPKDSGLLCDSSKDNFNYCTAADHQSCNEKDGYTCTNNDGQWKWRQCDSCSAGTCNQDCDLTSASWSTSSATVGDSVSLTVNGNSNCNGKTISFEVWESDIAGVSQPVNINPPSKTMSSGKATTTWIAEWQNDISGDPEYYFKADSGDDTIKSSTEMTVSKKDDGDDCSDDIECQSDVCADGPGICFNENTCFSNNQCAHWWYGICVNDGQLSQKDPGLLCDSSIDNFHYCTNAEHSSCEYRDGYYCGYLNGNWQWRTLDLQNDFYNCGTCGNTCDAGETCNQGTCFAPECGDGICSTGEDCAADCFKIMGFIGVPDYIDAEEQVDINVRIKNTGTVIMSGKTEAAIVPDYWEGHAFSAQSSSEISKCCTGNEYYQSRQVYLHPGVEETVTYTVTAPNPDSEDDCASSSSSYKSAWDNSFTVIAGVYEECGYGYGDQDNTNVEVNVQQGCPNGLDGSSSECSCNLDIDCSTGYVCDETIGYGACIEETPECTIPDGSSADCDCDNDNDCKEYGNYICNEGPGYDACIHYTEPDECNTIDNYECKNGDVYRCEQQGTIKKLVLVDLCTVNEVCPSNVNTLKQCKNVIDYDLQLEYSSSGTIVNKQAGDKLRVIVDVNSAATLNFDYDTGSFDLILGDCDTGQFHSGKNYCIFEIENYAEGKYEFTLEEDTETVNVIYDPYVLYITNVDQLYKRFNDDNGVDVLLAKTYEKAEMYKGVVYDMDLEINNHPFDFSFSSYWEKLLPKSKRNNDYVMDMSNFVHDRCNGCRETIIVGDDYVVPQYSRSVTEYDTSFLWWGSEEEHVFYTDIGMAKRETLLFSDFDEVFKKNGVYEGKDVAFVMPSSVSTAMNNEIENLKQVLMDKGYKPDFEVIDGNTINCIDDQWFLDAEGNTLFIIGTEDNNKALSCYPFAATTDNQDTAFMERNLWDGNEYAVIVNTDDEYVVKAFAELIKSGEYVDLKSESAYFTRMSVQIVSYVALGVAAVVLVVGSGGTALPAMIATAAAILDSVADGADAVDTCAINQDGMGWCGFTIGMAVLPFVPSKPLKNALKAVGKTEFAESLILRLNPFMNVIENTFHKLEKYFSPATWKKLFTTEDDLVYMGAGTKRLFGENIDDAMKDIPKTIHFTNKLDQGNFIKTVGKCDENFVLDNIEVKNIKFGATDGADAIAKVTNKVNGKPIEFEIVVKNGADPAFVNRVAVPHEYGHIKYNDKIFSIMDDINPGTIDYNPDDLMHALDEFAGNSEAKELFNEFDIDLLFDKKVLSKDTTELIVETSKKQGITDLINLKAFALKNGRSDVISKIDDVIKDAPYKNTFNQISETLANAEDITSKAFIEDHIKDVNNLFLEVGFKK